MHGQLGPTRRLMARLRRVIAANRHAVSGCRGQLPVWFASEHGVDLDQVIERQDALAQDLELTQERARLLAEELAGAVGRATNDNLYLLSILTAIFLPITLITGIFGMNVGGLPWLKSEAGFWAVLLVMLFTVVFTLLILHWRRLF
jgi:zinc transporter